MPFAGAVYTKIKTFANSGSLTPTDLNDALDDLGEEVVARGFFPGDMKASAVAMAQTGWLLCDGAAVSRSGVNAALFAAVGTAFGPGNGSTTFNLPNMAGRVPVGLSGDISLGEAGGSAIHTLIDDEIPTNLTGTVDVRGGTGETSVTGGITPLATNLAATSVKPVAINPTGGQGHNNMQPFLGLNWFIKQ